MDAGRLQSPNLTFAAAAAAACGSSCCCNVPATYGHYRIFSNIGWRRNSVGLSLQHQGIVFRAKSGRRRTKRARNVVQASLVNDIAAMAMAAAAAAVLPMCWHYASKATSAESSSRSRSSASSSPVSSGMTAALEAAGLPSSAVLTDATPTTSSRLTMRDTVNCVSGLVHLQSHPSVPRSNDACIEAGWSNPSVSEIGYSAISILGEGGARSTNSGAHSVSAAVTSTSTSTSAASSVEQDVDVEDKENANGDSDSKDPVSSYSELSALLADAGVNSWNSSDSITEEYIPDSVALEGEPRVNGVSALGGYHPEHVTADHSIEELKEDFQPLCSSNIEQSSAISSNEVSSAPVNPISPLHKEGYEEVESSCTDQAVREKLDALLLYNSANDVLKASAQSEGNEISLTHSHVELDDRTNGSGGLSTATTEQEWKHSDKELFWEQTGASGSNGSLLSTTEATSVSRVSSRLRSFKRRRRRTQSVDDLLADVREELLRIQDGSLSIDVVKDPARYRVLYDRLLSSDRIQDCLELLEGMDKVGILDMNKVYHVKFFHACKRHQAVQEAFRFIKLIKNPLPSTYNLVLSVCSSAKDVDGAFEAFSSLEKAGLKADCMLYTSLISVCSKAGKVDLIFKVFHEMVNVGVEPNKHTYGALIDGCARAGQVGKAFGVYGIMRSKKVKPDQVIFNSLITACGRSGALERAFDVLSEMQAEPIPVQPNHVTIGALIKACTQAGQLNRALEVYRMMQEQGIQGTAEVYTEAVHACSWKGDLDSALSIYKDMKNNLVQPDEVFFSALIDVAGHAGQIDAAFQVLEDMKHTGLKPGATVYSALMGVCSNAGKWERALDVYRDIQAVGLSPTISTMNALITALCGAGQLKESVNFLEEMRQAGMVPNHITYSVLLEGCEKADDIDLAFDLYKKAASEGVVPTAEMCKSITGICLLQIWKSSSSSTLGSPLRSVAGGRFCDKCTSWALSVYRRTVASGVVPTVKILSQLLGCLRLPVTSEDNFYDVARLSDYGSPKQQSLMDGFGVYDPRALALFEEAAGLGVVPSFSFTDGLITVNIASMPVFVAEVCLLTLLKGFKHRNAAGARLPPLIICLAVEKKQVVSPKTGQKMVTLISRSSHAVAALLRRLRLNFHGYESSGKLRITSVAIRNWLHPKPNKQAYKSTMWQLDSGPQHTSLARKINEQQRMIRFRELRG